MVPEPIHGLTIEEKEIGTVMKYLIQIKCIYLKYMKSFCMHSSITATEYIAFILICASF